MADSVCKCKKPGKGVMVGTTLRCSSCGLPLANGQPGDRRPAAESKLPSQSPTLAYPSPRAIEPPVVARPVASSASDANVLILDPVADTAGQIPPSPRGTVPVDMTRWPIFRSAAQAISGFVLAVMFGFGWLILPFLAVTIALGVVLGLGIACVRNGLLVMRHGRRYTVGAVFGMLLVVLVVGLAIQPGLAYFIDAAFFRADRDYPRLHSILASSEKWPYDFRNRPAQWLASSGLRRHYHDAYEQAAKLPPAEAELSAPFQQLLNDLAKRGSPEIVVDLQEEVDPALPPQAQVELLASQVALAAKKGNVGETEIAKLPKSLDDLAKSYASDGQKGRTKELAQVLTSCLAKSMPDAKLRFVTAHGTDTATLTDTGRQPRLELRGHVKHSGHFFVTSVGSMESMTSSDELASIPSTDWKLRLIDGDGNVLGEAEFTMLVAEDATWSESNYGSVTDPQVIPRKMAYDLTTWELARRFGFDGGPVPKSFPLTGKTFEE